MEEINGLMPEGNVEYTEDNIRFVANMPTEEVYTLPKFDGVNGRVVGTKPFAYQGSLIENFVLDFEKGKVVNYRAEKGQEVLENLILTDAGSCRLGEVALVPVDSPISQSGILFYNTLFDENASCHLAFGKAYPRSSRALLRGYLYCSFKAHIVAYTPSSTRAFGPTTATCAHCSVTLAV